MKGKLTSSSVYINILIDTAEGICEGRIDCDSLSEICLLLYGLYEKMKLHYESLKKILPPAKFSSSEYLLDKLEDFRDGISKVERYLFDKDKAVLKESLKNIHSVTEELFSIFDDMKERPGRKVSFSKSPLLDEIILAAGEVEKYKLPHDILIEKLDFMEKFIEATEEQIYSLVTEPDSVTFLEEVPEILNNLSLHLNGLEEIREYFKDRDKVHIDRGISLCLKATGKLFYSLDIMYEGANIITKVICLRCGSKNSLHSNFCLFCSSQLPKTAPSGIAPEKEEEPYLTSDFCYFITHNFNCLFEAAKEIEEGAISSEEFLKILSFMKGKVREAGENLEKIYMKKGNKLFFLFDIFKKSLLEANRNIELMNRYAEDRDEDSLDEGLNGFLEISKIFCHIQSIGGEAERELSRRRRERE